MIKVNIFQSEKNECVGFSVSGHAGAGVAGEDIVCSAVSILVINTINSIESFTKDEFTLLTDEETGMIEFNLQNKPSESATLLLKTMILGLQSIEDDNNYEEYIDIIFEEV